MTQPGAINNGAPDSNWITRKFRELEQRLMDRITTVATTVATTTAGHVIADEGTALPQQPVVNFVGTSVVATDDPANNRTTVTITGGFPARATASATSSSLANNSSDSSVTISLATTYRLISITTDRAARVRVYSTTAQRTADLSRAVTVDPAGDAGVVLEFVSTGAHTYSLSPIPVGASLESTPSATIPMTVQNLSGSTSTVTVSFVWEQCE